MNPVSRTAAWLAVSAVALSAGAAWAQNHPGQIPDPSTYQGSMELQRREREQQQQNQPAPQPSYQPSGPRYSGGASSGGAPAQAAPQIDWWARPPLAAARNPLLGRWQAIKPPPAKPPPGPRGFLETLGDSFVNGFVESSCDELFGEGVFEFRADTLVSVHPDGSEVIKNHVAYRADGKDVVVLPRERGSIPSVNFSFEGHDRVIADPGCPMTRIATSASARTGAGAAAAGSGARRTASAVLTLQAGDSIPGNVMPFQGLAFYLVNQDPAAALAKNGFAGPSPIQAWLQACRTSRDRCQAGATAMSAGAVAAGQTNAAGAAVMPPVPPGHYYVFGHVPYHGRELIWHRSVELQPGPNGDFLDQTNGTVG